MMPMLRVRSRGNSRLAIAVSSSTFVVRRPRSGAVLGARTRQARPAASAMFDATGGDGGFGVGRRTHPATQGGTLPTMSGPEHAAREHQPRVTPAVAAPVRRQVAVGAVDDPAEREADEVAERIVASLDDVRRAPAPTSSRIRRSATADALPIGAAGGTLDDGTTSMLNAQLGRGRSLDAGTRGTLEPHFGADLGGVRVHEDPAAAELNRR